MKRFILFITSLALSQALNAASIRNIDIRVELDRDGSALFTERWDVEVSEGTEWYLVKENLRGMELSGLTVSDETGKVFENTGEWDINKSLAQKAGKCGIVHKKDGYELCWGVGSYGDHIFTIKYKITNVVYGLDDYDAMHMQLVSPGLSSRPQNVTVSISGPEGFSSENTLIWGFGFNGEIDFDDAGNILAHSTKRFRSESSVIVLTRFNKGLFNPVEMRDGSFDAVLDRAMEGASFNDEDSRTERKDALQAFLSFLLSVIVMVLIAIGANRVSKEKVLGCKMSDIDWCRDLPFGGDILSANYVRNRLGLNRKDNVASAIILRMIQNGQIMAGKDVKGNVELSFNDSADFSQLSASEKELYDMMKEASGKDTILQKKEFSRWSARHTSRINKWVTSVASDATTEMRIKGNLEGSRFTEAGKSEARKVVGFEKYLKDFTIIEERHAQEVHLWRDYLVFAALFGIAEQVAGELRDINPQAFDEVMVYDYSMMNQVLWLSRNMASSITNARVGASAGSARGGFGGGTSFGGGGGFSGGGFGGGAR